MIIKLYKQMTEMRVHAEKKCRKILCPDNNFSPTIQMWYDRILAYLQLIRMKEGKTKNPSNILQFARRQHIINPGKLTLEETRTAAIKQTINREESKRMWYLIKRTVKDPHSPNVLKVQRVVEGKTQEYEVQEVV